MDKYGQQIESVFSSVSPECRTYISQELQSSLASIGFSEKLINEITSHLDNLDVSSFQERFRDELNIVYTLGFFQNLVPTYFQTYVVPEIPSVAHLVDIGCGTGILAHIIEQSKKVEKVSGIDIAEYPEWTIFRGNNIEFRVMPEPEVTMYLKKVRPEVVTMTWSLHHMAHEEQFRYLQMIFASLPPEANVILLEDSFAETLPPENGKERAKKFFEWDARERKTIMSVFDWVANRVLGQRLNEPIPFTFRTLEGWSQICQQVGFRIVRQRFIGFPEARDINTPQSLLVLRKE